MTTNPRRTGPFGPEACRRWSARALVLGLALLLIHGSPVPVVAADGGDETASETVANRTRGARVDRGEPMTARNLRWSPRAGHGQVSAGRRIDWWPYELEPPFGALAPAERGSPAAVMIGNARFLSHVGPPAIPAQLSDPRPLDEGGGYCVARFVQPLSPERQQALRERGIHILGYVPRGAYLLKVSPAASRSLAQLDGIDGLFRYEPAYKISPRIGQRDLTDETRRVRGSKLRLRVDLFAGESTTDLAAALADLGAEIVAVSRPAPLLPGLLADGRARPRRPSFVELRLEAEAAGELIPQIARLDGVRWIAETGEYRPASDWTISGWIYGDSRSAGSDFLSVRQPWNNGLRGEGILIGNVDTGVDFDHSHFADPVLPAVSAESPPTQACPGDDPKNSLKVPYYHLAPPSGELTPVCYDQPDQQPAFGHGTTTSGLIAADPVGSDNTTIDLRSGTAPEAQLWMYDAGPASGGVLALDAAALIDELEAMGDGGVSAVNFSFVEDDTNGEYTFLAEILDAAAWSRPGLLPVQAAGNDGSDAAPADYESVDATGKNVLSVGGNLDDSPNDLYVSSSRGPTEDARYKPDVIAPAKNTIAVQNANPDLDETIPLLSSDGDVTTNNSGLTYGAEGTSYSSASVAGAAGVVAQYFKVGFYPTGIATPADGFDPPNHLLKGVVINSALRSTGLSIVDDARPGKDQGWGRVKLNDPLYFSADPDSGDDPRRLIVFQGSFPQGATSCPGDSELFSFELFNVEEELRVTLSWTDYPGDHSILFTDQIVNDLDLTVTAPGGAIYRGNVFDETGSGWSITGGAADRVNTVENVWLPAAAPPTGVYTVEVCPYAIHDGIRQDFSLIVTGGVRAGEKVRLDQPGYSCADTVGVEVDDLEAAGPTVDVVLTSLASGDSETLTLAETGRTGLYDGTIATLLTGGSPTAEDGLLEVADGETIQVAYLGSTDQAQIDCSPALCYAVDLGPVLQHECDHDGFGDNGETLHLYVPLRNDGPFALDGATATLTSTSPSLTLVSDSATYGSIPAGEVGYPDSDGSDDPFVVSVSGAACDEIATLSLSVISGDGWSSSGCAGSQFDLRLERDPYPLEVWDFDDGSPQGWTHEMAHLTRPAEECDAAYADDWNTFPSTARSHGGSYAMQLGNGSYPVLVDAGLVSPSLVIPSGGARLGFYYWMEADIFDDVQVWHGFIVEASSNGGASWTRLTPVQGYNALAARNDCQYAFPFGNTAPDFLELFGGDGDGTEYSGDVFDQQWTVDLAAYATQTVQIRFRFGADDYVGGSEGLYIDTVTLEGYQCETPNICDDDQPCTIDSCDPDAGGCQYQDAADGTGCDDGEACTDPDECSSGVCAGTELIACDDTNPCTDDRAEDDGDDVCDNLVLDCVHENNTAPCDDSDACSTEDICSDGACTGGPAPDCNDLNACTDDSCDTLTGCVNAFNSNPCGDPYACTETDTCVEGQCVGTPNHVLCDDGFTCTSGSCEPGHAGADPEGCVQTPVIDGTTCDDEDVCTTPDSCQGGFCTGDVVDCSDGYACTDDLCDPVAGCSNPGTDVDSDGYDICSDQDPVNPDGLEIDCDDGVAGINPGMLEDCFNDQDDDCNNLVDESDPLGCPLSDVSGTVVYYRDTGDVEPSTKPVASVTMTMVGTASATTATGATGYYEILDTLKGLVSVIPSKTGDWRDSISGLDSARVAQQVVELYDLTPWQFIAGDVTGNGTISGYDAALIAQFRVGIILRFPVAELNGSDWAFAPDQRDYAPLDTDLGGENYTAILYGDVTGNWTPPAASRSVTSLRSTETRVLETPILEESGNGAATSAPQTGPSPACKLRLQPVRPRLHRRGPVRYVLYAEGADGLLGLDLDLTHSSGGTSIDSVSTTERTADFHLVSDDADGVLKVSMYGDRPVEGDGALLEFLVRHGEPRLGTPLRLDAVVNEGNIPCSVSVSGWRGRPSRP